MNDLSLQARGLIEDARTAERPPAGARERVRGAVAARIAVGAATTAAAGAASAAAKTGAAGALLLGGGITAVVAAAVVASVVALRAPAPPATSTPSRVLAPVQPAAAPVVAPAEIAAAPAATPEPAPAPAVRRPTPHRPVAPAPFASPSPVAPATAAPAAAGCTTQDELVLLESAQAALRESDGRRALGFLDRHERECPGARFREERRAARVLALCLLGRQDGAIAEAARLAAESPRSPQLVRLRSSCAAAALKP